jgi:phenylpyruvate tautomerase PptA (4-oxalocrotonate tautomerase family)
MPVYECLTTAGTLTQEQRSELAAEITTIHTEETGSPADFVHVVFPELPAGHAFTAGSVGAPAVIRGQIRAGRAESIRRAIITRVYAAYTRVTGAADLTVVVAVLDVPAQWAMEAGMILPEPTREEEEAWFASLRTKA